VSVAQNFSPIKALLFNELRLADKPMSAHFVSLGGRQAAIGPKASGSIMSIFA
jgi:hypothetical protein